MRIVNKASSKWVVALVLFGATTAFSTWHLAAREFRQSRSDEAFAPAVALLRENETILGTLAADGYTGPEAALLERYLSDIRRDGLPKHAATRRSIDALVDNNTVIAALLAHQAASLRTLELRVQAEKYRDYAASLRDRWHSTFEIFMAGGSLPAPGPERPSGIAAAVNGEIAAQ